ncbi:hypothetical protein J1G36_19860 [Pseudomonas carnis]|uniref:hypothetical protein n=2 Tax=Pseudomonas carnis TaxID=2487355 RepID=UPI001CA72D2B|nr:hypothetical protein [Pseudomonas carnis]MBY8954153.1 hypothetical protein [Pseudomonas carnis]
MSDTPLTEIDMPGGGYPMTAGSARTISYLLLEQQQFQGRENATARLYNNRRQVSEFLITLEARDEHGQVTVVPDGTTVEIIPFIALRGRWPAKTGPHEKGYLPFDESFTVQEIDSSPPPQSYRPESVAPSQFLPAPTPEPLTLYSPDGTQTQRKVFKRYLTNDANPGGMVDRFAVRVRLPGTSVDYTSRNEDVPYGGAGQNGRFYSSVYLRSVTQNYYTAGNGGLVETVEQVRYHSQYWYTYNHYIGFNLPGTARAIAIKHVEHDDEWFIWNIYDLRHGSGKAYFSLLVGVREPDKPNFLWYTYPSNWNDQAGQWLRENGYFKPSTDRLVFVVSGVVPTSNSLVRNSSKEFTTFDAFGNSQRFKSSVALLDPENDSTRYSLRIEEAPVNIFQDSFEM